MRKLAGLFVGLLLSLNAGSQNLPTFRQFNLNPFVFNPAFNAIDNYTEFSVIHRQQWLNFNDAPVASGFAAQVAMKSRASLGFIVTTQQTVALRNSLAKAVFAYKIPFSKSQTLSFGLSLGIGYNDIDLDGVDYSNDPTILNAADNKAYGDGSFGLLYSIGELKIGFALPRLFGQPSISPQELGDNVMSQLKNQLYSLSYKIEVIRSTISLEPYFLYRLNRDNQNTWEAATLIYFKDKIWTGASYHSTQGLGFFLGISIKTKFRFGYSYELPPPDDDFISTSSHEIQINLRIGEAKTLIRKPNHD
jgi:type IX secretion system PorP/SprF family membrane protein